MFKKRNGQNTDWLTARYKLHHYFDAHFSKFDLTTSRWEVDYAPDVKIIDKRIGNLNRTVTLADNIKYFVKTENEKNH